MVRLMLSAQAVADKVGLAAHTQPKLPSHYKALVATRTGSSFRDVAKVVTKEVKHPGSGEVLVKIAYAGINGGCETFRARGEHWFKRDDPSVEFPLGAEGTGTVAAVGPEVEDLEVGQTVACLGSGAFSEYVTAKAASCYPIREASAQACACVVSGLTAAAALEGTSPVRQGETALITAGAGATGSFGVQIARLAGAHVIATCGSSDKARVLQDLGAHRIINYRDEDVATVLREEYPQGIDVAYEGVGGRLRQAAVQNLTPQGRLLGVGYISSYPHTSGYAQNGSNGAAANGQQAEELTDEQIFWGGKTVQDGGRTIYGSVWPKDRSKTQVAKKRLFDRFYDGTIKALVDEKKFAGAEAVPDAVDYMLTGQAIGKVVVKFS